MPASHVTATGRFLALSLMLVVVAACGDKAAPDPSAGASGAPDPSVSHPGAPGASGSAGVPGASAGPGAGGETSGELITAAYEAGTIDRPTALLYRLQASIGDDRLPAAYAARGVEDSAAATIVVTEWDTFTEAQREALLPYVVRPSDPRSVFAAPRTASTGRPAAAAMTLASSTRSVSAALTADACVGGFIRKEVPDLPVVVWGQCAGLSDAEALASTDEVAADVEAAWGPLSGLMGDPIGDANNPDDSFPDAPEGDDGLLDVYVVAGLVNGRARSITTDAIATTYPAPPLAGPTTALTTSAYMVVDRTRGSGVHLKSTIVHELFHAFQFAHNNGGLVQLGPDGRPWKMHWFMEASAVWSEHEFVPEARDPEVYRWVDDFQEASVGLASNKDGNEYASWLWPLFMRQEEGPEIIGATWFNLEGVSGFDNLQQAIGQDVPFEDRFRDFAVRAYNQHLEPGDPIDPAFWDLDPTFPDEPPVEPRAEIGVEVPPDGKVERSTSMPPLWSHSTGLITVDVPTVTFDFDSLSGTPVTADLLVLTKDRWERRPGNSGKVCDAEQVIVILANSDPSRGADTTATWSATGSDEPCNDGNWTVILSGKKNGAGTYTGRADSVECYERADGSWQFSVNMDPTTGDVRHLTGNPDGILINTRFASDDPIDWGAIKLRGDQITVTGDKSKEPWTVHAEATWHDVATDSTLTSRVDVICSEWFTLGP